MQIVLGIDCRQFTLKMSGIANVLRSVVDAMLKYHPQISLVLFAPSQFDKSLDRHYEDNPSVIIVRRKFISEKLPKILWYNLYFPFLLKKYGITDFLSIRTELPLWLPEKIRSICFVHDVVAIEYPETMEIRNRLVNRFLFSRSILNADLLWCVSNYTKSKVLQYFPDAESKIAMVGSGSDPELFRSLNLSEESKREYLRKFGINGRPLLFVGNLEPRKNLSFLLKLMPQLYDLGFQLIVVGAGGWKNSNIAEMVNAPDFPKESVHFCGYVSDEDLVMLYNCSECYVSTSLNEGFGLPQLEAMLCGCRVVSPANSAMIEIVGGRGELVPSWDVNDWIHRIQSCCAAPAKRTDLKAFMWENLIDSFVGILKKRTN